MRTRTRFGTLFATLSAAGLVLAGCGDNAEQRDAGETAPTATTTMPDHSHSHGHDTGASGDPNATPANQIQGAELVKGRFQPLPTAPKGTEDVTGTAWLARHDGGTAVTIKVSGLEPGTEYMSHLHEQPCAQDNGGPHFKFDPKGSDEPPNEVHLMFTADSNGTATTTVNNDNRNSEGAQSIVLHLTDAEDTRFTCADL